MAVTMFVVVTACRYLFKLQVLDEFNDAGTMGAFGFLGSYVLVTIAAPMFVKQIGERKPKDIALCAAALVLMLIPAVGSVYPVPDPPVRYFPYIFSGLPRGRLGARRLDPHERSRSDSARSARRSWRSTPDRDARHARRSDPPFTSVEGTVETCPCRSRSRGIASPRRSGRTGCRVS